MGMLNGALEAGKKAVAKKEKSSQGQLSAEMSAELFMLETAKIHPDPNQPRKEWLPDELAELKQTIAETEGCHTPIKVRPHPEKLGEYMIVYGEGRWLSHNQLGYATIPALVDTKEFTPYQLSFAQLTENLSRKSMTRFDEANAIKDLMEKHDPKLKQNQIAQKLGKQTTFISRLLKLIKAPKAIQELSKNGITQNINVLDSLTRIAEIISEEELMNYIESVVSGAISEKELLQALNDFKAITSEEAEEQHDFFQTESRESDQLNDPLNSMSGGNSERETSSDKEEPEQDYGFYDYRNYYEKALFDVLFQCDIAFEISEAQKDEAAEKLETVTAEFEAKGYKLKDLLSWFVKDFSASFSADDLENREPIKTVLNIRTLRALIGGFVKKNESNTEQEQNIETPEKVAELQSTEFFNMGSYEVFDGYVLVQPDMAYTMPIRLTKAELKELLEAE
ncbi:ParB/RepB/Spo0J family partition protein [Vibrio ordalii]|uniref:ParB/RepB/Spo0J family partition protein n=1 Tax=Vibrio ordalii TaxID=28174 RepID=UPI00024835C0|nr:ParB/RepB/Spo0J family partition protein [Vibrio ordalii]